MDREDDIAAIDPEELLDLTRRVFYLTNFEKGYNLKYIKIRF